MQSCKTNALELKVSITDHEDLLLEILARLPAKSLLRFKSVSKRWLFLISSPDFCRRLYQDPYLVSGMFLRSPGIHPEFEFISLVYHPQNAPFRSPTFATDPSALGNPQFSTILKLNGTNYKQWVESLMMNLTIMKLDMALREDSPPKPDNESSINDKKLYDEWEYSNRCCLMIMRYHMEDSIRDSIPKIENAKEFFEAINKKYKKFSKNEKNELLSTLHSTIYDGVSGIREHMDKIVACYHKIKAIGMELDEEYIVWFIMGSLPSQFDSIRSSYNAQKEQWTIEEMTTILAKEEDDMKKGRARSVAMVTNQNYNGQKRKFLPKNTNNNKPFKKQNVSNKGNGQGAILASNVSKIEGFKGKCNYCQKFGHKKTDCRKLNAKLEKKGDDKQKETK